MSALLPALLAGAGTAVLVGLPQPRRVVVLGTRARRTAAPPPPVLPLVVGLGLLLPLGPVGALVAAGLTVLGRRALTARRAAKERAAERAGAAEAMVVLAAELRAGRAPEEALRRAADVACGPAGAALAAAVTAAAYGGAVPATLLRGVEHSDVPEVLRGLAACWAVCQGMGGSLATAVEQLEEGLRTERRRREEVDAELAAPRASAAMLAGLPLLGLALGSAAGGEPLRVLLHEPLGNACLVVGVALDLLGVWWTGRIVARAGGVRS